METTIENVTFAAPVSTPTSKFRRWAGYVVSGIPVLFLAVDGAAKLARPAPVIEGTVNLGFPPSCIVPLGIVLLACVALHLYRRTAILGAVLLTGYLGGAIATHVRVGDPLLSHVLFPVYLGVFIWLGLFLRDPRARGLVG
jgi:hypothetical protein